jgi:Prokaryotic RING finger family 1
VVAYLLDCAVLDNAIKTSGWIDRLGARVLPSRRLRVRIAAHRPADGSHTNSRGRMGQTTVDAKSAGKNCPYCRFPLKGGIPAYQCESCGTIHHSECWDDGGGCAVFGCVENRATTGPPQPTPPPMTAPMPPVRRSAPIPIGERIARTPALVSYRTGVEINGLPLELWLVVALFGGAAVYLVQWSMRKLPDLFRFFHYAKAASFVLIVEMFMVAALGLAFAVAARMLIQRRPVGRDFSYVVIASLTTIVFFTDNVDTGFLLFMLGGFAAAATLALAPAVRELFVPAPVEDVLERGTVRSLSLAVARRTVSAFILLLTIAAVLNFVLGSQSGFGSDQGKYIALGVIEVLIVVGVQFARTTFGQGDPRYRFAVSGAAFAAFILLLVGSHTWGFTMIVGVAVAAAAYLWLPADVRASYGDSPIRVTREQAAPSSSQAD